MKKWKQEALNRILVASTQMLSKIPADRMDAPTKASYAQIQNAVRELAEPKTQMSRASRQYVYKPELRDAK